MVRSVPGEGVNGTRVTDPGAYVEGVNGRCLVVPDSVISVMTNLLVKFDPIMVKNENVCDGVTREVGKPVKLAWYF